MKFPCDVQKMFMARRRVAGGRDCRDGFPCRVAVAIAMTAIDCRSQATHWRAYSGEMPGCCCGVEDLQYAGGRCLSAVVKQGAAGL